MPPICNSYRKSTEIPLDKLDESPGRQVTRNMTIEKSLRTSGFRQVCRSAVCSQSWFVESFGMDALRPMESILLDQIGIGMDAVFRNLVLLRANRFVGRRIPHPQLRHHGADGSTGQTGWRGRRRVPHGTGNRMDRQTSAGQLVVALPDRSESGNDGCGRRHHVQFPEW